MIRPLAGARGHVPVRRGTGILPVGLRQTLGHGQDAHATCATVNRQMRQHQRILVHSLALAATSRSAASVDGPRKNRLVARGGIVRA
jgi:hypothetical protein